MIAESQQSGKGQPIGYKESMKVDEQIRAYLQTEILNDPELPPLDNGTSLLDSHLLDSVAFLDLVLYLETTFNISVADADLTRDNFETVDAICGYVGRRQQAGVNA
jgi:acyl carrier protein